MLRSLRITLFATSLLACLLLIALRVQSYFQYDALELKTSSRLYQLRSQYGQVELWIYEPLRQSSRMPASMTRNIVNDASQGRPFYSRRNYFPRHRPRSVLGFGWTSTLNTTSVFAPYWFLIMLSAALAALTVAFHVQWTRRFSLRALFIATALIAVLLGAVNYASR